MVTAAGRGVGVATTAPGTATGIGNLNWVYAAQQGLEAVHQGLSGAAEAWFVLVRVGAVAGRTGTDRTPTDREE